MEMMLKITGLALSMVLFATVLKKDAPEQALMMALAFTISLFFCLSSSITEILDSMERLADIAQLDTALMAPVVKTVAISITSKITGELCRCAGEGGTASLVEFAGAVLALVMALPLVEGVMEMMWEML